jgi:hypothetical protein
MMKINISILLCSEYTNDGGVAYILIDKECNIILVILGFVYNFV